MPMDFTALGIQRDLTDTLWNNGVKEPTPIQEQAIPSVLSGFDVIAQAQTGTGKTLAFLLPILEKIDPESPHVQALVVTPTRELALQITDEAKKLAPKVGATVLAAYGGQDVAAQVHKLKGGIHIVIGTPGRLLDHLRRGTVQFDQLKTLVLDEADQMLHMGFKPEVEEIISYSAKDRQTLLFSATMPDAIRSLAKRYMNHPQEIKVEGKKITLEEIKQVAIETSDRQKQETLIYALKQYNPYLAVVFCRTKRRAAALNGALISAGFATEELHGDLTQAKREKVMKAFREARFQVLVATDVAARGLDVEGVTHVFNYDIPGDVESYIHRIGRTGRAGSTGMAITFFASRDRGALALIEQGIEGRIQRLDEGLNPLRADQIRHVEPPTGVGAASRDRKGGRDDRRGGRDGAGRGREQSRGRSGARGASAGGRNERGAGRDERGAGKGGYGAGRDERGAGKGGYGAGRDERGAGKGGYGAGRDERGAGKGGYGAGRDERGAGKGGYGAGRDERGAGKGGYGAGRDERGAGTFRGYGAGRDERGAGKGGYGAGRDDRGAGKGGYGAGRDDRGAGAGRGGYGAGRDDRSAGAGRGGYGAGRDDRGAGAGRGGYGAGRDDRGAGKGGYGAGRDDRNAGERTYSTARTGQASGGGRGERTFGGAAGAGRGGQGNRGGGGGRGGAGKSPRGRGR